MKKINLLFAMLLVATMGIFTSCSQDTDSAATLTITGVTEGQEVTEGTTLKLIIQANDADKLKMIEITPSTNGATGTKVSSTVPSDALGTDGKTLKSGLDAATINYDYVVPAKATVSSVTLSVKLTDAAKTAHDTTVNVMFKVKSAGKALKAEQTVMLGGSTSAKGSYYASVDGATYTGTTAGGANSTKIDLVFKDNTLFAPSDAGVATNTATLTTKNATMIGKLSSVDYGTLTTDANYATYAASATATKQAVAMGDVLVFKTASTSAYASAIAVAKVTALASDEITFTVKLQNTAATKVMTLRTSSK